MGKGGEQMSKQQIVELEEAEHLLIKTPHGEVRVFIGAYHRSIHTFVPNVSYGGVYTKSTEKKSQKKMKSYRGWRRLITLRAVDE
jgi:hypothetical protein